MRDEFGAPTGQFRSTSETFDTERKAKARLRKVEDAARQRRGVDPSSQKAKANTPLGTYARSTSTALQAPSIQHHRGYEKLYRTHIGPYSVASQSLPSPRQT